MKKVIFFDWDGTIASTKASEFANVQRTKLFEKNIKEDEIKKLQINSHNNHYEYIQKLIKDYLNINDLEEIKIFQGVIFGYFYISYFKKEKEKLLLVDIEKLKELKQKYNLEFVIVTSLYKATIKAVLRILKLEDLFDVFGCDVTLKEKKSENLKRALDNYNEINDYKPLLMIGDRGEDIEAGKNFSLNTIYCDYGHGDSDFSADFIIKSPNELIETIEDFLKNLKN